jgi:hypothetical protein
VNRLLAVATKGMTPLMQTQRKKGGPKPRLRG